MWYVPTWVLVLGQPNDFDRMDHRFSSNFERLNFDRDGRLLHCNVMGAVVCEICIMLVSRIHKGRTNAIRSRS